MKTSADNYEFWEINATMYGEENYEKKPSTAQEVCPSVLNYFFNRPLRIGPSGQSGYSYLNVNPIFPIGRSGQSRTSIQVGSAKLSYVSTINSLEIPENYEICGL